MTYPMIQLETAIRRAAVAMTALALAGCAVGPNFREPATPHVERYTTAPLPKSTVATNTAGGDAQRFLQGESVPRHWWSTFGNAELDRRVQQAFRHSPSIAAAEASLKQAEENARAADGTLFPALDAKAGVTRQKQSGASFGDAFQFPPLTVYNASVNVSYTFDLFGGVRRGIEAQKAQADYQRALLDATYLTLAANVVTASLQEASLSEQIQATRDILDSLEKQLDITRKQQAIGAKSLSDTLAVRAQLSATMATLPPLEQRLAATRNQLATYLGVTPAQLKLQTLTLAQVTLPTDIPVSLPSAMVAQRPDIRAASASLHAATAEVGVAIANMLPQITLSGSGGSAALHAGDLFSAGSGAWSIGLNLLQPLFHGGELLHKQRASRAGMQAALADWQQTVLLAFQNVADTLQALEYDAQSLRAQASAERDAEKLLSLSRAQYRVGAVDYLTLLSAERQYQQARIAAIAARSARLADTAALYAALGGGLAGRQGRGFNEKVAPGFSQRHVPWSPRSGTIAKEMTP
ncbi:MAG: efflux transporter outer membrane subunit [Xanthomonadaceae bacterium]|nr:efflux transporter outer membrane subunit [Xanthomonadaceae bacterium]MDE1959772.1 efflux transporter outer membrane subunit [Xanthomonadaceae bacterium]MDE2179078.1 efflux transporter outer membrane subunit [Xanthomonadaceae bacterium]MDE2245085.1 efflux transporter outer membrane subunit [Xanthomonadaceae bacterium]